jgi:sugar phosphate permease
VLDGPGVIVVNVSKVLGERKARKWLGVAIIAVVALQIYFVQEMIAALILFTGVFVVCAAIALVLYLVDRAGRWGLGLAEQQTKRALVAAEEISKKQLRRPRSEPAQ